MWLSTPLKTPSTRRRTATEAEMPSEKERSQRQSLEIPAHRSDVDLDAVESPMVLDLSSAPLPSVHVSNANLAELKAAMDEAVKRALVKQQFSQSHLHTDVKLILGWAAALTALGSTAWAYRLEFEETKVVLSIAVAVYMLLSALQFLYSYYIEGRVIYVGKRKSLTKRIETEAIQVLSSTSLFGPAPSQQTITTSTSVSRPSSPLSPARSPRSESPAFPTLMRRQSILPVPTTVLSSLGPTYALTLLYTHTTNSGKSLIRKAKVIEGKGVGEFFDSKGGLEEALVEAWVTKLVASMIGNEDTKQD